MMKKLKNSLFYQKVNQHPVAISTVIFCAVFFLRFVIGGCDPSYFILLSKKNVIEEQLVQKVIVQEGGYDGQFFYRYALNPFSSDVMYEKVKGKNNKEKYKKWYGNYGIKIDNPPYRRGRIIYPLCVWMLALGQPSLVPYMLILVNLLAFFSLSKICKKIIDHFKAPPLFAYFPLLIGGLYFSAARDLSDALSCALLAFCYWCFIQRKIGLFLIFTALALLCRETNAFFLAPAYCIMFLSELKGKSLKKLLFKVPLFFPWILLVVWKVILNLIYPDFSSSFINEINKHFGWPFEGMTIGIFPLKAIYIIWTLSLLSICIQKLLKEKKWQLSSWTFWTLWISVLLTVCYAYPIYCDHWSFVRIYAPTHLFCFFFLLENKVRMPKWFIVFSLLMIFQTIGMVILIL